MGAYLCMRTDSNNGTLNRAFIFLCTETLKLCENQPAVRS